MADQASDVASKGSDSTHKRHLGRFKGKVRKRKQDHSYRAD